MNQVTQEEFYSVIGPQDAILKLVGEYPYTTEFRLRHSNRLLGLVVETDENIYPTTVKYLLV